MNMRCIQVEKIGSFQIVEQPVREPLDDEVLIKVDVAGLCRTDLKLIRVGHRDLTLPRVPAEEVVGTIEKTGNAVTSFNPGERVYVYPGVWCGTCPACMSGAENLCRDMRIMGFHRDGGFAEYVTVPEQSLIRVPDGLASEEAVFAEPLSCCLNALELAGIGEGKTIGIWGAGPAGTLLHRAAAAFGGEPFSIDPDERRCALIGGFLEVPERCFDICIVAVGSKEAYEQALSRLNPRGRLVVFSGLSPEDDSPPVSFNQLHYMEQTVVGAYGCGYRHGLQALELISSGAVQVKDMISHRMSLWDLEEALNIVEKRQGMKILLYPA